ncbi:hypothetical protein RM844_28700 [Streptomyces sp. DSM 44915]|uniref:Uncharacterized protein n=1 Tax=Streptomyces chisholmiae TaxID=3075540 RepID=A0ABU2JZ88_9ACTN|nr:hypothetical protein [Streptomyces sp. DSM 44915]MDT0270257.1 hypothetical protein [Streptomyces sp. DSM 44915]
MSTPPMEPAELRQLAQDTEQTEAERLIAVLLAISVDLSRAVRLLGKGR